MPESWRLFVAAAVPDAAAAAIWERLAPVRDEFTDTRWIKPELMHLTLLFLGDVGTQRVPEIGSCLDAAARRHAAYATTIDGAGGRFDRARDDRHGSKGGGVAWLTLGAGVRETTELALTVDAGIGTQIYDARRQPRPHLTVARAVDHRALATLQMLAAGLELGWTTQHMVLFRSYLGRGGSRYDAISTHALSGPPDR